MLNKRELDQYYRREAAGGRSAFGRALDYAALRLILFVAFLLFFRSRLAEEAAALTLAGISLAAAMLLLRVARILRLERFTKRETARIRGTLLADKLMRLPEDAYYGLVSSLAEPGAAVYPLQRAEPADADAVLSALRAHGDAARIAVFCTSGYAKSARLLAERSDPPVKLIPPDTVSRAVRGSVLTPSDEEVQRAIEQRLESRKAAKRSVQRRPFAGGLSGKYAFTALLLTAASFFTGYALYYRMLAGICMLFSVLGVLLSRDAHAKTV